MLSAVVDVSREGILVVLVVYLFSAGMHYFLSESPPLGTEVISAVVAITVGKGAMNTYQATRPPNLYPASTPLPPQLGQQGP